MADDDYRAILTPREKEILSGDADVSDKYRYRVITRVRDKINKLERRPRSSRRTPRHARR